MPVTVTGDVLSFGSPSLVGAVEVTPLFGGFLSVLRFIAAFSFVTLDVGRSLGLWRLRLLLLGGYRDESGLKVTSLGQLW